MEAPTQSATAVTRLIFFAGQPKIAQAVEDVLLGVSNDENSFAITSVDSADEHIITAMLDRNGGEPLEFSSAEPYATAAYNNAREIFSAGALAYLPELDGKPAADINARITLSGNVYTVGVVREAAEAAGLAVEAFSRSDRTAFAATTVADAELQEIAKYRKAEAVVNGFIDRMPFHEVSALEEAVNEMITASADYYMETLERLIPAYADVVRWIFSEAANPLLQPLPAPATDEVPLG